MVPPRNVPADPLADPALWNGTWTNWCSELDHRDDDADDEDDVILLERQQPVSMLTAMSLATVAAVLAVSLLGSSLGSSPLGQRFAALTASRDRVQ